MVLSDSMPLSIHHTDTYFFKIYSNIVLSSDRIFGELQQLSHVPVDLFRRFATEIGLAGK